MDKRREDNAGEVEGKITIKCKSCEERIGPVGSRFATTELGPLISASSPEDIKPICPHCQAECRVESREFGCPACHASFWAYDGLLGHGITCPHCGSELELPSEEKWKKLAEAAHNQVHWLVRPAESEGEMVEVGEEDLVTLIRNGRVGPDTACVLHEFAPPIPLREACDEHVALRRLYDPVGVWMRRGGEVFGALFCALYVVGHVVGGLMIMGTQYLLVALFGVLAVALTPTVVGLFIVYVIARGMGIPLLGAYVGVLLVVLSAGLVFFLGSFAGKGLAWLAAKVAGVERRRVVGWD